MPAPRGTNSSARPRNRQQNRATLPAAITVVLLAAIIGVYIFASQKNVAISSLNLCPAHSQIPEVIAVLLDTTDRISPAERVQIQQAVDEAKRSLPRFGRLRLYLLPQEIHENDDRLVDLCNPGTGENISRVYQNPRLVQKKWEENFSSVIDSALDIAANAPPADQSAILEQIRAISIDFLADPINQRKPRKLIVISDFLQHVPGIFSQYGTDQIPAEQFLVSTYARSVAMDLRGVEIELFYIERPAFAKYQNAAHLRFWIEILQGYGGDVTRVKRIFGG